MSQHEWSGDKSLNLSQGIMQPTNDDRISQVICMIIIPKLTDIPLSIGYVDRIEREKNSNECSECQWYY